MSGKVTNPSRVPKNAVQLSKVSSLTFYRGKLTTSRRVEAVSQLECVGPEEVCKLYNIDVMRCVNEGADYDSENIQWSCKASLPEEFKLGSTDVVCEGYESSDDPYVLKGSCGVEYRLILTDKGEEKYSSYIDRHARPSASDDGSSWLPAALFFVVFVIVLFIIVQGIWSSWNRNPPRLGGHRHRPLGSSNDNDNDNNDDDDDPPPPYDGPPLYYSQPQPKTKASSASTATRNPTSTRASSSRSAPQRDSNQGWRPGFWTGTAAGAAAGYLAGNRSQRQQAQQADRSQQQETQQRPGGFFSNFMAPQQRPQAPSFSPSPPVQRSESSSAPTYSSARHESTGFGSTRRR